MKALACIFLLHVAAGQSWWQLDDRLVGKAAIHTETAWRDFNFRFSVGQQIVSRDGNIFKEICSPASSYEIVYHNNPNQPQTKAELREMVYELLRGNITTLHYRMIDLQVRWDGPWEYIFREVRARTCEYQKGIDGSLLMDGGRFIDNTFVYYNLDYVIEYPWSGAFAPVDRESQQFYVKNNEMVRVLDRRETPCDSTLRNCEDIAVKLDSSSPLFIHERPFAGGFLIATNQPAYHYEDIYRAWNGTYSMPKSGRLFIDDCPAELYIAFIGKRISCPGEPLPTNFTRNVHDSFSLSWYIILGAIVVVIAVFVFFYLCASGRLCCAPLKCCSKKNEGDLTPDSQSDV